MILRWNIQRGCMVRTENGCRYRKQGNTLSDEFTPYPKNPLIANFFTVMGRSDAIGSGVKNLYKYTPIYSRAVIRNCMKQMFSELQFR